MLILLVIFKYYISISLRNFTIFSHYLFICYSVYSMSKSLMTIKHCSWHADLISYSSFYIFLYISVSFRNLITLSTSQFFPNSFPMSPWILYFFLLSFHWGNLIGNVLLLVFGFYGDGSFLDIRCPWVSLECQIRILLSLTSYCLQL